jgi:tetratricopeptide (TPR) repeat protein
VEHGHHLDHATLVLRWVEGIPLIQAPIAELELSERIRAAIQIAEVVAHLHRNQVLHRDIKPHNLIWSRSEPEPGFVLIDFDFATRDLGLLAESVGTLGWAAPEHAIQRACRLDPGLDLYALGTTLYFLFTGRPLFAGNQHTLARQALVAPEEFLSEPSELVPDANKSRVLRDLLIALLQPVPGKRCQDAEWVLQVLRGLSSSGESAAPAAGAIATPAAHEGAADAAGNPREHLERAQDAYAAGDVAAATRLAERAAGPGRGHDDRVTARALALSAELHLRLHQVEEAMTAAHGSIELAGRLARQAPAGEPKDELAGVLAGAWLTVAQACRARDHRGDTCVALDAWYSVAHAARPPFAELIELELYGGRPLQALRLCLSTPDRGQLADLVRALRQTLRDRAYRLGWEEPSRLIRGTAGDPETPYWQALAAALLVVIWRGGARDQPRPGESPIRFADVPGFLASALRALARRSDDGALLEGLGWLQAVHDAGALSTVPEAARRGADMEAVRGSIWGLCASGEIERAVELAIQAGPASPASPASPEEREPAGEGTQAALTRTLIQALEWVAQTTERSAANAGALRQVAHWLTKLDRAPLHLGLLEWLYAQGRGDDDDLERLALGYQMAGKADAALELWREAVVSSGAGSRRKALFIQHLLLARRFDEARSTCARFLQYAAGDAELWQLMAEAECRLGRWQPALDAAHRARELGDRSPASALHAAEALLELGRPAEALPHATEALQRGSEADWDVYVRALRATSAPRVLETVLAGQQQHPRSALLWCHLGEMHLAAQHMDSAREAASMAWALGARLPRCAELVCELLLACGAPAELAQAANACARLGAEPAELALRTRLAAQARDHERTLAIGLQAVAREPGRLSCWRDLYQAWLAIGDLDQAFMAASMLDRLGAPAAEYARRTCLIAACESDVDAALAAARAALDQTPEDRELALVHALVLLHARRPQAADRALGAVPVDTPLVPDPCTAVAIAAMKRLPVADAVAIAADVEARFWAQALAGVAAGDPTFTRALVQRALAAGISSARLTVLGALAEHAMGETARVADTIAHARTLPHGDAHVASCARLLVALDVHTPHARGGQVR